MIVDFKCHKVTTMTIIIELVGDVTIEKVFPLLDITKLDLNKPIRQNKKFKIPYCGVPGAILSAKYQDMTRGILKSNSKKSFLNSITIDICTSKKNINAKLSGNIIHTCGSNSEELAMETANHIINHLKDIQDNLNYIHASPKFEESIQWVKDNTIGEDFMIDSETQNIIKLKDEESIKIIQTTKTNNDIATDPNNFNSNPKEISLEFVVDKTGNSVLKEEIILYKNLDNDNLIQNGVLMDSKNDAFITINNNQEKSLAVLDQTFFIKQEIINNEVKYYYVDADNNPLKVIIKKPIYVTRIKNMIIPKEYPNNYPENVDERIINFYIKYSQDFAYHHVYCQFLDSVKEIKTIITPELSMGDINIAMINYSYSLGMNIDRWELATRFNKKNGFTSRFNNATDHCVIITKPYKPFRKTTKKPKKPPCHTFMIYKSGIVTQSGPDIDMMRDVYYLFMETINEIRPHIIRADKMIKLKIKNPMRNKIKTNLKTNPKINLKTNLCQGLIQTQ